MTDGFRDSGVHEFKREIPEEEEEIIVSSDEDIVLPEEAVIPGGDLPGGEVLPEIAPADNVEGQDNPLQADANPDPGPVPNAPAPNNPPPPGNNPNPNPEDNQEEEEEEAQPPRMADACLLYTSPSPRD